MVYFCVENLHLIFDGFFDGFVFCFLVSSRLARNDDDEEEAARERRRRARQERLMSRESEDPSAQTDSVVTANSHR